MDSPNDGIQLDQPPAEDSPNHILNALTDDCLQECFRRLPTFIDFLNVASVCQKFRANARACFPPTKIEVDFYSSTLMVYRAESNYKLVYPSYEDWDYGSMWITTTSTKFVGPLLYHFGDLIKIVFLYVNWFTTADKIPIIDQCFAKIIQYCAKTLNGLILHRYRLNFDIGKIFPALELLEIYSDIIIDYKTQPLPHLKVLILNGSSKKTLFSPNHQIHGNDSKNILEQTYPQLQVLALKHFIDVNNEIITNFLIRNNKLRMFDILDCASVTTSILNGIGTRLPNLENLSFYVNNIFSNASVDKNWTHVFKIPNLKHFNTNIDKIPCTRSITDFLTKNNVDMEKFLSFYELEPTKMVYRLCHME